MVIQTLWLLIKQLVFFYNKSESLCKDALEILHYDSTLRVWFDRDISFEVGGDLSADIVSLPRLVTSRSHEKLSDDSRLTSKQSVKLAAVERSIHNIGRDIASASKDDASKLDKFLSVGDQFSDDSLLTLKAQCF